MSIPRVSPLTATSLMLALLLFLVDDRASVKAFHVASPPPGRSCPRRIGGSSSSSSSSSSTALNAIAALAKKAKEADLRRYVQGGVDDDVMEKYDAIKQGLAAPADDDGGDGSAAGAAGPLQDALTVRRGTITVIAEYKRKNSQTSSGVINEVFEPELVSPVFREYGASAIAVMADERMGGSTYDDLAAFVEEQRRARNDVPGSVPVINNDLIIDELQVARSAAVGCSAIVLNMAIVDDDETIGMLMRAARAVDLEVIVAVSTREAAQRAVNLGASMISVIHVQGVDDMVAVLDDLDIPDGRGVCKIANILSNNSKDLQEVEDAWAVRDKGFNCVWVGEALYKAGADNSEHPGAIIKSMKAKSSLKWASPKAYTGRGEGAREYLGDILM